MGSPTPCRCLLRLLPLVVPLIEAYALPTLRARPTRAPRMSLPASPLPPPPTPPPEARGALVASMDEAALALGEAAHALGEAPPRRAPPPRGPDGRLLPVLTLPGDSLDDTPIMPALLALSSLLAFAAVGRAFACGAGPLAPLLGVALGGLAGELLSGAFHWATDNYGSLRTPVVGFACAAFQGHHLAPWTISYRSAANNVHKIGAAALAPTVGALLWLPPVPAAFVATLLYSQLLAQEFHRWTHTPPHLLAAWQRGLQDAGIALGVNEHVAHHKPPFDKHYCILTGRLNAFLDEKPVLFWRRLEALVYRINGQEPNSWKDPRVKEVALRL